MKTLNIRPDHKAIKDYFEEISKLGDLGHVKEGSVAPAFSSLLKKCAQQFNYTLVEQYSEKNGGHSNRYDGLLVDEFKLHHGIWEAKDTGDKLDVEIKKKFERGYPNKNIMFQEPKRIVIYQNGRQVFDEDVTKPEKLVEALKIFFEFEQPIIEDFHKAVEQFKAEIPRLAQGLQQIIDEEQAKNQKYKVAFASFAELCKKSINPNISEAALEEMLIQHLLTERLFRTVFNNPDFIKRNVIAAEIEKVIEALASRSFNRSEFTSKLDRFYRAIEEAARDIKDWGEMQGFMNTVYEKFFQGFAIKVADTHGIVYTPQPIVNFMVRSVEDILQREFGRSLSDEGVHILDPFVGTGNFIMNVMRSIRQTALTQKYEKELHCNEVMLLPYYVACMNIEHEYWEKTGTYQPFEGICFVDTFQLAEPDGSYLFSMTEKNTERVEKQKKTPIFVIISNPPYNAGQVNENDNNKNRKYPVIDKRVAETYAKDSSATNKNALSDVYVKAIRWASDRINKNGEGIVAVVTNNSFIDQIAFDGMRKHLKDEFDLVYVLDLGGNVRKNPKLSGTTHNVFGIQVGVSINFFIKKSKDKPPHPSPLLEGEGAMKIVSVAKREESADIGNVSSGKPGDPTNPSPAGGRCREATDEGVLTGSHRIYYHSVHFRSTREEKFEFINKHGSATKIDWEEIVPDKNNTWLTEGLSDDFEGFIPLGKRESKQSNDKGFLSVFKNYSPGVQTNRDDWAYNHDEFVLSENMKITINEYNLQAYLWERSDKKVALDDFINYDYHKIQWSSRLKECCKMGVKSIFNGDSIRKSLYRPFSMQFLYFDTVFTHRRAQFPKIIPDHSSTNLIIVVDGPGSSKKFSSIMTSITPNVQTLMNCLCFPFYTYNEDGTGRKENITDWALEEFREHYSSSDGSSGFSVAPALPPSGQAEIHSNPSPSGQAKNHSSPSPSGQAKSCSDPSPSGRRKKDEGVLKTFKTTQKPPHPDPLLEGEDQKYKSPPTEGEGPRQITKWDIFYYVYGLLHHPGYRKEYEANLRRELPRIPFAPDFWAFSDAGRKLADLHVNYESQTEYPLEMVEVPGVALDWRVEKMKLSKDKTQIVYNDFLTLAGIPPEVFEYRLGNRSALDWIIDQYRVTTDERSGITNDPNRDDEPEYIVRLIKKIVTVSIETVEIVKSLEPLPFK